MKLPAMKEAIRIMNSIKKDLETVRSDLEYMRKITRINCTTEQCAFRNSLESEERKLSSELHSTEMTIVKIQWYGESVAV